MTMNQIEMKAPKAKGAGCEICGLAEEVVITTMTRHGYRVRYTGKCEDCLHLERILDEKDAAADERLHDERDAG